jgi:DNA-directed RNA polymerase subunit RPC12/RpoP
MADEPDVVEAEAVEDDMVVIEHGEDGSMSTTIGVELIDGGTITLGGQTPEPPQVANEAPEKCPRCGATFGFTPAWRNDISQMWYFCTQCSYPIKVFFNRPREVTMPEEE